MRDIIRFVAHQPFVNGRRAAEIGERLVHSVEPIFQSAEPVEIVGELLQDAIVRWVFVRDRLNEVARAPPQGNRLVRSKGRVPRGGRAAKNGTPGVAARARYPVSGPPLTVRKWPPRGGNRRATLSTRPSRSSSSASEYRSMTSRSCTPHSAGFAVAIGSIKSLARRHREDRLGPVEGRARRASREQRSARRRRAGSLSGLVAPPLTVRKWPPCGGNRRATSSNPAEPVLPSSASQQRSVTSRSWTLYSARFAVAIGSIKSLCAPP